MEILSQSSVWRMEMLFQREDTVSVWRYCFSMKILSQCGDAVSVWTMEILSQCGDAVSVCRYCFSMEILSQCGDSVSMWRCCISKKTLHQCGDSITADAAVVEFAGTLRTPSGGVWINITKNTAPIDSVVFSAAGLDQIALRVSHFPPRGAAGLLTGIQL